MRAEEAIDLSKVLFLDIETVPQEWEWEKLDPITASLFNEKTRYEQERTGRDVSMIYSDRAGILSEFGKIVCIGVGRMHCENDQWSLRVTSFHGDDERALLQQFSDLSDRYYNSDEHWLCGHNAKEFDFPFIARRCVVNSVQLPRSLRISGRKPWEVGHLDTMSLWCFGDRKAYTSLALLAHILGIPTPKDDIKGADVARIYHAEHDIDRIARYCRKDVIATAQLYLRLTGREIIPATHITEV